MAQLTWKNVDPPSFVGETDALRLMGQMIGQGFSGLQGALDNYQRGQTKTESNKLMLDILRYTDPASLDEALRSGSVLSGVNPRHLSKDAIELLSSRPADLLANQGKSIANSTSAFNLSTAQRDDAQAQARLAAQPEAAKLLATVRTLAGSGDPAKVEQARTMLAENTQTLIDAGYRADAFPGLLDAERAAGKAGFEYEKEVHGNQKYWEGQEISQQARNLAHSVVNNAATYSDAVRAIQNDPNIKDPRVKAQAIEAVKQISEANVFQQPTQADQLLMSLGQVPSASPLVSLADKTEGAGNYDTLFKHSQRQGGAFAGMQPSRMTLGQLNQFDQQYGPWVKDQLAQSGQKARIATPIGRFQIVGDTRRRVAKAMGLSDDTVFDEKTQNAMFEFLVNERLSGPRTMTAKINGLREEWAGFKNVSDDTLAQAITAYENGDRSALLGTGLSGSSASAASASVKAPGITLPVGSSPAAQLLAAANPVSSAQANEVPAAVNPKLQETPNKTASNVQADPASSSGSTASLSPSEQLLKNAAPSSGTSAAATPTRTTSVSPTGFAQTLANQSAVDRIFNGNGSLMAQLQEAQNSKESIDQVATRLVSKEGPMPSGNHQAALAAIRETINMSGGRLSPAAAGALVANNAESRDLTSQAKLMDPRTWDFIPWIDSFFDVDKFATKDENWSAATRTNMNGVAADLKQIGLNVDGSIDRSKAANQFENQRVSALASQNVGKIHAQLLELGAKESQLIAAIQRGQDTAINRAALVEVRAQIQQFTQVLQSIAAPPSPIDLFAGAGENRPTQ